MNTSDIIVIAVVALVVVIASVYIYRKKKCGAKCIGCPDGSCSCKCPHCSDNK